MSTNPNRRCIHAKVEHCPTCDGLNTEEGAVRDQNADLLKLQGDLVQALAERDEAQRKYEALTLEFREHKRTVALDFKQARKVDGMRAVQAERDEALRMLEDRTETLTATLPNIVEQRDAAIRERDVQRRFAANDQQARIVAEGERDAAIKERDEARAEHGIVWHELEMNRRWVNERTAERDEAIKERDEAHERHANYVAKHHEYVHPDAHDAALASVAALRGALENVATAFETLKARPPGTQNRWAVLRAAHADIRALLASPNPGAGWVSTEEHEVCHQNDVALLEEARADNAALRGALEEIRGFYENSDRAESKGSPAYCQLFMRALVEPVLDRALASPTPGAGWVSPEEHAGWVKGSAAEAQEADRLRTERDAILADLAKAREALEEAEREWLTGSYAASIRVRFNEALAALSKWGKP